MRGSRVLFGMRTLVSSLWVGLLVSDVEIDVSHDW